MILKDNRTLQKLCSGRICSGPHVLRTGRQNHAEPDRGPGARDAAFGGLAPPARRAHGRLLSRRGLPQADGADARPSCVCCTQLPY